MMSIHDDSHAKAILKREKRLFSERFHKWRDIYTTTPPGKFRQLVARFESAAGDGLMHGHIGPASDQRSSKRQLYTGLLLEPVTRDVNFELMDSKKVCALSGVRIDSKTGTAMIKPIVFVSDHALERAVRRNQCHSWKEITAALGEVLTSATMVAIGSRELPRNGDFIIAVASGYAVFKGNRNLPVLKTWLPSSYWSRRQARKLSQITGDRILLTSMKAYHRADRINFDSEPVLLCQ